jgi:hypothetical protein
MDMPVERRDRRGMDVPRRVTELRAADLAYTERSDRNGAARLAAWRVREADAEILISTGDALGGWVTLLVCKQYGVKTFRRRRMQKTTIGVRAPEGFIDEVLRPHILAVLRVFTTARDEAVKEIATAWLGAKEAAEPLVLDEEL